MFIGICGSLCSGKSTVAKYLVEHHGFTQVSIHPKPTISDGTDKVNVAASPHSSSPQTERHLTFANTDALLDYVTQRWRDRWVTIDGLDRDTLETYSRRPFFLLISVDAPLLVRYKRYRASRAAIVASETQSLRSRPNGAVKVEHEQDEEDKDDNDVLDLEGFAALSDTQLYHPQTGQATHISTAPVRLLNTSHSLASLYANLGKLDLLSPERLRPSWDNYFMSLASLAAQRSNCMKRRVGCVVVSHNHRVISTGYNGTPRGIRNCGEGGCGRCNSGLGAGHGLTTCLCIHAEENALLEAGRDRLREGAVLYCDTCPCLTCSIKIAQVGISEVVYAQGYSMDKETAAVFAEAGVRLRQFVPPANGLIHLENMEIRA